MDTDLSPVGSPVFSESVLRYEGPPDPSPVGSPVSLRLFNDVRLRPKLRAARDQPKASSQQTARKPLFADWDIIGQQLTQRGHLDLTTADRI